MHGRAGKESGWVRGVKVAKLCIEIVAKHGNREHAERFEVCSKTVLVPPKHEVR